MSKWLRYMLSGLAFLGLVAIRMHQEALFYDPLIVFFKTTHTTSALPQMDTMLVLIHTTLRFLLNTGLSLFILWCLFVESGIIKIASIVYVIAFLVLIVVFWVLLSTSQPGEHMVLFYVRRFLIQPIFLLLFIPAFYFQRKK